MAENEPLQQKDMEFFGAIVTAQVKQSQWASNQVEENLQRDAKEWRDAFVRLWDMIDKDNDKVDSMRIGDTLMKTAGWRDRADQPFYWEKENH
jgi:hypothetical protein